MSVEVHSLDSGGPEARRQVLRLRAVRWSADAAHRRACETLTNTMPSAVCVEGVALTDLAHALGLVRPNVRAKRATTAGRQARAGENVPRTARPGPGGLPLALRLSEGLGSTARREATEVLMDDAEPAAFVFENASASALNLELAAALGTLPVVRVGCRC